MNTTIKKEIYKIYRAASKLNLYVAVCKNTDKDKIKKELNFMQKKLNSIIENNFNQ